MIPLKKHLSWRCPSCGEWNGRNIPHADKCRHDHDRSVIINKLVLHCLRCDKRVKFKRRDTFGANVAHEWHDHPSAMTHHCISMNARNDPSLGGQETLGGD